MQATCYWRDEGHSTQSAAIDFEVLPRIGDKVTLDGGEYTAKAVTFVVSRGNAETMYASPRVKEGVVQLG